MAEPADLKPAPDVPAVSYGPHPRNVLDLWLARSEKPAPLVVFIHGGGFRGGSKGNLPASLLSPCLSAGITVAAINYRLSDAAPYPAAMLDGARAVQFLRSGAARWNLDPARVGATGSSAGGGISLWLGFHKDLADPGSADPVLRQSTCLTCMAVVSTQSFYDLNRIARDIAPTCRPEVLLTFFRLREDELDTPRARQIMHDASAINHATADAPPVFLWYAHPNVPVSPTDSEGTMIHHPRFGNILKERLDQLGVECTVRYGDDYPGGTKEEKMAHVHADFVRFFLRHFRAR